MWSPYQDYICMHEGRLVVDLYSGLGHLAGVHRNLVLGQVCAEDCSTLARKNNHKSLFLRTLHMELPKRMQRHDQQHEVECNVGYARAEEVCIFPFATSLKCRIPIGPDGDTLQDARHGERNPPCDSESPN